jgi:ABC-type transport system involved in multi-copper enzyme maturation permease subunit
MAWVDIGERAALVEGSTTRGWAHFEYDNASGTSTRPCRIRIEPKSGSTFNVIFRNITIAGTNYGTVRGVTQSSGTIWSGNISAGGKVTATWENPWNAGTKYPSITGNLPSGGAAPSGGYITYNSSTHDSITATTGVSNWGSGYDYRRVQSIIVMGSSPDDFLTVDSSNWFYKGRLVYEASVSAASLQQTMRQDNYTDAYNGPLKLKGMRHYMLAYWNYTNVGITRDLDTTVRYMPPAPSIITYTKTTSGTSEVYTISFVGDTSEKNSTSYERPNLSRTIRYKIDNGSWIVVENSVVKTIDAVSSFSVTVPPLSTATIEGWMTYHGQNSETTTVVITNSSAPKARIYGSVNNASKRLAPLYGTFGNYFDGRHYLERSNMGRLAVTIIIIVLFSSLILFLLDPNMDDLLISLWFVVSTVTSVGYGDVTPSSTVGRLIGIFLIIIGYLILSIFIGSISSFYQEKMMSDVENMDNGLVATKNNTEELLKLVKSQNNKIENLEKEIDNLKELINNQEK